MLSFGPLNSVAAIVFTLTSALVATQLVTPLVPSPTDNAPTTLRTVYGLSRPERLNRARTALVLVDFQEEFFSGGLKLPEANAALDNATRLLTWARRSGMTIAHVRNVGAKGARLFAADGPNVDFVSAVRPAAGELVIVKSMAGGFTNSTLHAELQGRGVDTIVVSGLMTHLAVDSTVRDGLVLGYHVLLPGDASASRDLPSAVGTSAIDHRLVHDVALATLADRFADVLPTEAILALPLDDTNAKL